MVQDIAAATIEIIYEINRRLLMTSDSLSGDEGKVQRISLIEEGPTEHVRMANLAIVGSHSTNGVAEIHSRLYYDGERPGRHVSGTVQQQDQWRYSASVVADVQPAAGQDDHRSDR